ncbi:MAG: hypothetical protein KKF68_03550 [Nanoarchaeota archaeon]|nr:hypothetical protein [Nanoarchaeota archaeon]
MPIQNTLETKEKILFFLRRNGPSLPVHIAKEIEQSILFTSAFLSELLSEKKIRLSNMRVGSSPIYFLSGQESLLEKYSIHLKSKEKDAFILLKEEKFLIDKEQVPAIRVALREIKDFAIPFKKSENLVWRYLKIPESEFKGKIIQISTNTKKEKLKEVEETKEIPIEKPFNVKKKTVKKKKPPQKNNEKFFNRVKEFLLKERIELIDIKNFSKNELSLIVKEEGKEILLVAYNKKRIN